MNTLYYGDNLKILREGGNPRGSKGAPLPIDPPRDAIRHTPYRSCFRLERPIDVTNVSTPLRQRVRLEWNRP